MGAACPGSECSSRLEYSLLSWQAGLVSPGFHPVLFLQGQQQSFDSSLGVAAQQGLAAGRGHPGPCAFPGCGDLCIVHVLNCRLYFVLSLS